MSSNEDVAAEFDRLDKDKNGVLSPDEVVEVIREIMHLDDVRAARMVISHKQFYFTLKIRSMLTKVSCRRCSERGMIFTSNVKNFII